jgi:hypothetical protein
MVGSRPRHLNVLNSASSPITPVEDQPTGAGKEIEGVRFHADIELKQKPTEEFNKDNAEGKGRQKMTQTFDSVGFVE